jgi:hypothetical protein
LWRNTPTDPWPTPPGLNGVVVGEGDTFEEALADVKSAVQFHIDTFGPRAFRGREQAVDAFVAGTRIAG